MAIQKRNSEMVDLLKPDFVHKQDSAFAWAMLMQMYQNLPGVAGFWSMGAINKEYVQRFGYYSGYDHDLDALGIGTIDPSAGSTISPCITAGQVDGSTAYAIVDRASGVGRMAINGINTGGFQMYDHAGGAWNLGYIQENGNAYHAGRIGGAWITLPYVNAGGTTWTDFDGASYAPGKYKLFGDLVILKGLCKRTAGAGTTIAVLPGGYRPPITQLMATITDSGLGRIDINAAGEINLISGGTAWVSLNLPPFSVAS